MVAGAVEVQPAGGKETRRIGARVSAEGDLATRVALEGLTPATRHAYRVRQGDLVVAGEFTTAPVPGTPAPRR